MDKLGFFFAAYAVVWILLFAYTIVLSRRNRALEREIDELRVLLEQRAR